MTTQRFETIIVGGGQAGLAMGYHLARRGRPFVILEANERIGDSWRNRWDSLRLFTPARYDGLPGLPFPAPGWSFLPGTSSPTTCATTRRTGICRCAPAAPSAA